VPPEAVVRVTMMVAYDENSNGVTVDPKQEMVGEAVEVHPAEVVLDWVKTGGIFDRPCNVGQKLLEEGVAQTGPTDFVVVVEHRRNVVLDVPVID